MAEHHATRRSPLAGAALLAAEPAAARSSSPLLAMVEQYRALSGRLAAMPDTELEGAHLSAEYEALDAERCVLAGQIIAAPARTDAELRAKALCAADWFSGRPDDLGDCLVASLLGDLGQQRGWLDRLQTSDGGWRAEQLA